MLVSLSVDIDAPPTAVWPYLVEPEKTMAWFTALKRFDWTSHERGVGATFHWYEEAKGRAYDVDFETTEWSPPHVFGYRMTGGDFSRATASDGSSTPSGKEAASRSTITSNSHMAHWARSSGSLRPGELARRVKRCWPT